MPLAPGPADLEIINAAYALIGADPIQSIDIETPGAAAAVILWGRLFDHALGFYPWSFATRAFSLALTADDPGDGWTNSFLLPAERIGPPLAVSDTKDFRIQFTDYTLAEDRVHSDKATLWARCKFRAAVGTWSGPFTWAFTNAMAAEFALSVTSDAKLRQQLRTDTWGPETMMGRGGLMGQAIQVDAQAKPSPILASDGGPLLTARRGGLQSWGDA